MNKKATRILAVLFGLLLIFVSFGCSSGEKTEISEMKESIKTLQKELTRLQDVNEIQRLMGRYETIHNAQDINKTWELFADRDDSSFAIATDAPYVGLEAIKNYMTRTKATTQEALDRKRGVMLEHPLSTPMIVVADDGQTAKGVWWSFGHETHMNNGVPEPKWAYGKYANDFIKIDGKWYIWHVKWFRVFRTPIDTAWSDLTKEEVYRLDADGNISIPEGVYFKPYTTDLLMESIPAAPAPYKTWTEEEEGWQYRISEHP